MAERSNARDLRSRGYKSPTWVRIPLLPPSIILAIYCKQSSMSRKTYQFSEEDCLSWQSNPGVNPISKYPISIDSKYGIYAQLVRQCNKKVLSRSKGNKATKAPSKQTKQSKPTLPPKPQSKRKAKQVNKHINTPVLSPVKSNIDKPTPSIAPVLPKKKGGPFLPPKPVTNKKQITQVPSIAKKFVEKVAENIVKPIKSVKQAVNIASIEDIKKRFEASENKLVGVPVYPKGGLTSRATSILTYVLSSLYPLTKTPYTSYSIQTEVVTNDVHANKFLVFMLSNNTSIAYKVIQEHLKKDSKSFSLRFMLTSGVASVEFIIDGKDYITGVSNFVGKDMSESVLMIADILSKYLHLVSLCKKADSPRLSTNVTENRTKLAEDFQMHMRILWIMYGPGKLKV